MSPRATLCLGDDPDDGDRALEQLEVVQVEEAERERRSDGLEGQAHQQRQQEPVREQVRVRSHRRIQYRPATPLPNRVPRPLKSWSPDNARGLAPPRRRDQLQELLDVEVPRPGPRLEPPELLLVAVQQPGRHRAHQNPNVTRGRLRAQRLRCQPGGC